MNLYACSTNAGKLAEFAVACRESGLSNVNIFPLPGLKSIMPPAETGWGFDENAELKARYYSSFTDELVLAEDSGLEVEALQGAPGIHSARFAGAGATDEQNNTLVLSQMTGQLNRRARFISVVVLARQGEILHTSQGAVEGELLSSPRGSQGFGYDPLFFYPPLQCAFGELSREQKFTVSHRGNALRALFLWLAKHHFPAA